MEIDLNKEECTETSIFINFSIREYAAEACKKNPAKCWPFGSLGDCHKVVSLYESSEPTFLSCQNRPTDINDSDDTTEFTEALILSKENQPKTTTDKIESSGIDSDMGKNLVNGSSELTFCKVNNGPNRHEYNVDEGAKIRHNMAADNNEARRNKRRRKRHNFRLLSDIYKDPASELRAGCDRINPANVNKNFVTEIEDDSDDDVTLSAYFRNQKGVEITDSRLKKRDIIGVEEPRVDLDRKSNCASKGSNGKDSNVGAWRKKIKTDSMDIQTTPEHNKEATETEKENEDSEMAAVMLLALHFNKEKQILREHKTHTTCACLNKKIQSGNKLKTKTSFKTASKHLVKKITKEKIEKAFGSVQRRSVIRVKATTCGAFQSDVEMGMKKTVGVGPDAQNCAALECSFNRNPADFSTLNAENKFMRGG